MSHTDREIISYIYVVSQSENDELDLLLRAPIESVNINQVDDEEDDALYHQRTSTLLASVGA
jgi:hypothetical protein